MAGRATFTIVESRMIMSIPTQRTMRAIQRRRSGSRAVFSGVRPCERPLADDAEEVLQLLEGGHRREVSRYLLSVAVTGRVLARSGHTVRIAIPVAAVILAGCGSAVDGTVVDRGRSATPPYGGPLDAGAAVGALECEGTSPYRRGEGVYDDGLAKGRRATGTATRAGASGPGRSAIHRSFPPTSPTSSTSGCGRTSRVSACPLPASSRSRAP